MGGEGEGWGQGGEMAQTMYALMNKWIKNKKTSKIKKTNKTIFKILNKTYKQMYWIFILFINQTNINK
jgi:hypothetical protein